MTAPAGLGGPERRRVALAGASVGVLVLVSLVTTLGAAPGVRTLTVPTGLVAVAFGCATAFGQSRLVPVAVGAGVAGPALGLLNAPSPWWPTALAGVGVLLFAELADLANDHLSRAPHNRETVAERRDELAVVVLAGLAAAVTASLVGEVPLSSPVPLFAVALVVVAAAAALIRRRGS